MKKDDPLAAVMKEKIAEVNQIKVQDLTLNLLTYQEGREHVHVSEIKRSLAKAGLKIRTYKELEAILTSSGFTLTPSESDAEVRV